MDQTTFEHAILPKIEDFLEHCRKQLQSSSAVLFKGLDEQLNGLVVLVAFDTATQSEKPLVLAPVEEWVSKAFEQQIGNISLLIQTVQRNITLAKSGAIIPVTPTLIQPFIRRIQEEMLKNGLLVSFSEAILAGSYVLFTSLWFYADKYERHSKLSSNGQQVRSLVDACAKQFLQDSYAYVLKKLAESSLIVSFPSTPQYLLRKAGENLLARITLYLPKAENFQEEVETITRSVMLYDDLNKIAKMRYEGADAFGSLLICPPDHTNIKILIEFTTPIWSSHHRQVRKLLEIAHEDVYLLYYKGKVYGLGCKVEDNIESETIFDIEIVEHAAWRLRYGEEILMMVQYDQPSLQIEQKSVHLKRIEEALTSKFTNITPEKVQKMRSLVEMAMEQHHGTMLVISDHAEKEAKRLEKQSVHIKPAPITNKLMKLITAIDGAVLIDVDGICYAIGVILDGIVEAGEGDPSRGARYHAALKYLSLAKQKGHKCLIMVVSEDGMINIFPHEQHD